MIDILLATYNGERFLEEQLESLISQEFSDWRILARDDGSSDATLAILKRYRERLGGKLLLVENDGVRLGAAGSFSELMRHSGAPYLMFCDQDDVWLPGKVVKTLGKMREMEARHGAEAPLLVHTDFRVVDESLQSLAPSGWGYQKSDPDRSDLNRLLVQNVATGCTVMVNGTLRDLALPIPSGTLMHDWWLALIAAAFGAIGYLAEPQLLYRQHGVNAVGAKGWSSVSFLKQLRSLGEVRGALQRTRRQGALFAQRYGDSLPTGKRELLQAFAQLEETGFFLKRCLIVRYGFFHSGLLRKLGMLLFC